MREHHDIINFFNFTNVSRTCPILKLASNTISRSKYNAQHPPPFAERIHYHRSSETSEIRAEISRSLLPQDEWHPVVPEVSALTVGLRGTSRGYWPIANVPSHTTPHHVSPRRAMPIRGRAAPALMRLWASRGPPRSLLRRFLLSSRSLSFFPLFYMRLARPSRDLSFAEGAKEAARGEGEGEEEADADANADAVRPGGSGGVRKKKIKAKKMREKVRSAGFWPER